MASSQSSLVRAAKRSRTMSQGMGLNPMLMGLNPMLMSMFNQSMSPLLPEEDENEDEIVQAVAPAASSVATPKATPPPAMAPAGHGAPGDDNQGDNNEEFHNLSPDGPVSRSVTYLKQAPKNRLSEALEAICSSLDATLTSQLSVPGMLAVLWTYTRISPTTKISDLRSIAAICSKATAARPAALPALPKAAPAHVFPAVAGSAAAPVPPPAVAVPRVIPDVPRPASVAGPAAPGSVEVAVPEAPAATPSVPVDEWVLVNPESSGVAASAGTTETVANGSAATTEREICCICQDAMIPREQNLIFHTTCVSEWRHCARKTESQCLYRCELSHSMISGNLEEIQIPAADGAGPGLVAVDASALPPSDVGVAAAAEEVENAF
eukprot:s2075_g5.t1